jgi:hypothetical protein
MRITHAILVLATLLALVLSAAGEEAPEALPKVVYHAEPIYPPLGRQARIQGEVLIKITTDGESVNDVKAETGHPLLRKAAEDNARTWKFVRHTPGSFNVTFRYKLLSDDKDVDFLQSPGIVKIMASPPEVIIDYSWLGLGTWKARLKSTHGKSSQVLKLAYSGPEGDWLSGSALGPKGESEEITLGHKEGNFLAFTIMLSQPDGKHVKTYLIGRMKRDKIVGTSIDDVGIRGEWTAVRVIDKPNSQ